MSVCKEDTYLPLYSLVCATIIIYITFSLIIVTMKRRPFDTKYVRFYRPIEGDILAGQIPSLYSKDNHGFLDEEQH